MQKKKKYPSIYKYIYSKKASLSKQDTPTKELGEHISGSNSQVSEFSSPVASSSYLNRFTNSESSTDEEGKAVTTVSYTHPRDERPTVHLADCFLKSLCQTPLQVVRLSGTMTSLQSPPSFPSQGVISLQARPQQRTSPHPLQAVRRSKAGAAPPRTPASPSLQQTSPASRSPTSPTLTLNKEVSHLSSHIII